MATLEKEEENKNSFPERHALKEQKGNMNFKKRELSAQRAVFLPVFTDDDRHRQGRRETLRFSL